LPVAEALALGVVLLEGGGVVVAIDVAALNGTTIARRPALGLAEVAGACATCGLSACAVEEARPGTVVPLDEVVVVAFAVGSELGTGVNAVVVGDVA